jgi:hypothetical protein
MILEELNIKKVERQMSNKILVIAEKPSLLREIVKMLEAKKKHQISMSQRLL